MKQDQAANNRYRTNHWNAYNPALKSRGSLTVWLEAIVLHA